MFLKNVEFLLPGMARDKILIAIFVIMLLGGGGFLGWKLFWEKPKAATLTNNNNNNDNNNDDDIVSDNKNSEYVFLNVNGEMLMSRLILPKTQIRKIQILMQIKIKTLTKIQIITPVH